MVPEITCHCGQCKKCKTRIYLRKWREENRERNRATFRAWNERNRESRRKAKQEWQRRNLHKARASNAVGRAVARGDLVREPCEVCGAAKVEAHHEDYDKPLEVRWLCHLHHAQAHQEAA